MDIDAPTTATSVAPAASTSAVSHREASGSAVPGASATPMEEDVEAAAAQDEGGEQDESDDVEVTGGASKASTSAEKIVAPPVFALSRVSKIIKVSAER